MNFISIACGVNMAQVVVKLCIAAVQAPFQHPQQGFGCKVEPCSLHSAEPASNHGNMQIHDATAAAPPADVDSQMACVTSLQPALPQAQFSADQQLHDPLSLRKLDIFSILHSKSYRNAKHKHARSHDGVPRNVGARAMSDHHALSQAPNTGPASQCSAVHSVAQPLHTASEQIPEDSTHWANVSHAQWASEDTVAQPSPFAAASTADCNSTGFASQQQIQRQHSGVADPSKTKADSVLADKELNEILKDLDLPVPSGDCSVTHCLSTY